MIQLELTSLNLLWLLSFTELALEEESDTQKMFLQDWLEKIIRNTIAMCSVFASCLICILKYFIELVLKTGVGGLSNNSICKEIL